MKAVVFTGPTLPPAAAQAELDAVYLPPVAQGDVYRVAQLHPPAIGIIDGYFEHVPAVWHKEILWAMSQGIHVFGSASMGALRAAELAAFGMEGIGAIFAAYASGALEDDDAVAVAHGLAESGYRPLSTALVNIRPTLAAAEIQGIIGAATRQALERIAKALFYPQRAYPLILEIAAHEGLPAAELAALRAWLPGGQIDQKRDDAVAMLRVMRERLAAGLAPKQVAFHFEHTEFWDSVQRNSGTITLESPDEPQTLLLDAVLDELRLDPDAYHQARQAVLARSLAQALAGRHAQTVTTATRAEAEETFRREHGLLQGTALAGWLAEQDLSAEAFARLLEGEALLRWAERWALPNLAHRLPGYLRLNGAYADLARRAHAKQQALAAQGRTNPALADLGLSEAALVAWYFTERLGRPVPVDLHRYAQDLGFVYEPRLIQALVHEYCYTMLGPGPIHRDGLPAATLDSTS